VSTGIWGLIGALIVIVGAWPLAQRLRHPRVQPVAAWAIFLAVFAMVGGACLTAAAYVLSLVGVTPPSLPVAVALGALVVLVPGLVAASWAIRREPRRHKVKPD
jgi:hypothetical protein